MAIKKRFTQLNSSGSNHKIIDAESAYVTGSFQVGPGLLPGTDANFFVSGNIGGHAAGQSGVGVFGGDLVVSGNLIFQGSISGSIPGVNSYFYSLTNNIVETSGSLYVSGAMRTLSLSASNGAEITGSVNIEGTLNVGAASNNTVTNSSFVNGNSVTATGYYSHAEGVGSTASNDAAHAEGYGTTASGYAAHAEGLSTIAAGEYSHAEGLLTQTQARYAHAEGSGSIAYGVASHAEGWETATYGSGSFAAGLGTIANGPIDGIYPLKTTQAVFGKYNISDASSLFAIGDGLNDSNRHDVLRIVSGSQGTSVQITGSLYVSSLLSASNAVFSKLTGSLQEVSAGIPYLLAGPNITIATNSLGQIEVTGSAGATSPQYWFSTGSNETYTTGSVYVNAGANGNINLIKFDISGSGYQSANVNIYGPEAGAYIAVEDVVEADAAWNPYSGSITIAAATVLASGSGGSVGIIAGNGGYLSSSISSPPYAGGTISLQAGIGGINEGNDLIAGAGLGGDVSLYAGAGGVGYAKTGQGGAVNISAGSAGTISPNNTTELAEGGNGGDIILYAGNGGNSQYGGVPGIGGGISFTAGPGGINNNEFGTSGDIELLGANIPEISGSISGSNLILGKGPDGFGSTTGFRVVTVNKNSVNVLNNNKDTFLYVSGGIGQKDGSVPAIAVFGGDLHVSGGLTVEYPAKFFDGLSGSLTKLTNGSDYLIAGPNITITTNSFGQIEITGSSGASVPEYFYSIINDIVESSGSLYVSGAMRALSLSASNGAEISGSTIFAGAGGVVVGSDTVFFVSGAAGNNSSKKAVFGGTVFVSGNIEVPFGTSILSRNSAGNSWIGLTQYADGTQLDASYGNQLLLVGDGDGKNTGVAVLSDNMPIALITGSNQGYFSGSYKFHGGLSGSLTKLADGSDYLIAGTGITLTTGSNGSITIDSTGGGGVPEYFYSLTNDIVETSGSLYVSGTLRAQFLSASAGILVSSSNVEFAFDYNYSNKLSLSDWNSEDEVILSTGSLSYVNGTNPTVFELYSARDINLNAVNNIFVTASAGNLYVGTDAIFNAGLTGSLQEISTGVPYIISGPNITIATNSLGQIEITGSAGGSSNPQWYYTANPNEIATSGSAAITGSLAVTGAAYFSPAGTGRGLLNFGGLDLGPITGSALTTFSGGGYSLSAPLDGNLLSASYGVWDGVNGAVTVRHELHIIGIGYNSAPDNDYQLFSATYLVTSFIAESGVQTVKDVTEVARYTSGSLAINYDVNFDPDCTIGVTGSSYLNNQPVKWYGQRTKEMSINWFNART